MAPISTPGKFDDRVKRIVSSQLGVDVKPESNFINDLGADSLDTVGMVTAIEYEFNIEIPDEDVAKITTCQQAMDYVNSYRGAH